MPPNRRYSGVFVQIDRNYLSDLLQPEVMVAMSRRERKLSAIMFTDMVGYTALGQRNESLSLTMVDEQRKLIRSILPKHNGREVKTIGDAFLVQFVNALDAVRCAYDIQREVREFNIPLPDDKRLHLRIGLHLGDVEESDGDISGDAVNVASRIESLAEAGGVCLTRQVYDQIQNKLDLHFSSIGRRTLKNVAEPFEIFKMVLPWERDAVGSSASLDQKRIAVLPFANMSPDPQDEYFADGMTEEIISTISRIDQVEVISRTSVMSYKKLPKPVREISKELDVGTILEGSVRKSGNKLRVTVQLIDATKDRHVWAESYNRDLQDVFAIQSEIAEKVADSLRLRLDQAKKEQITRGPTKSMAAYNSYLAGLYNLNKMGPGWISKSIPYLEQAIAADPGFAQAYSGLANAYIYLAGEAFAPKEGYSRAKEYVLKALNLDDEIADAHWANANLAFQLEWNWDLADSEFRRTLELNPNSAPARQDYAVFLSLMNRDDDALREISRAIELDPLSQLALGVAAGLHVYARKYEKGISFAKRILEIDPSDLTAHDILAFSYAASGSIDEAYKELQLILERLAPRQMDAQLGWAGGLHPWIHAIACTVLPVKKQESTLREILARAEEYASQSYVSPSDLGILYLGLGDTERAFSLFEEEVESHGPGFIWIRRSFVFDKFRSDPRFVDLVRRCGLSLEP